MEIYSQSEMIFYFTIYTNTLNSIFLQSTSAGTWTNLSLQWQLDAGLWKVIFQEEW